MAKISKFCCYILVTAWWFGYVNIEAKRDVKLYKLKRGNFSMILSNYGASVFSFILPDKNGKFEDIVLGHKNPEEYKINKPYFGSIVGRVVNRIGGAQFTLNGTLYKLAPNEGKNNIHGGIKGFSYVPWTVQSYKPHSHVTFTYHSFDGEEGFPGSLDVMVKYKLKGTSDLEIIMKAKALNKATPVNLASHTYWNLGGHQSGNILSHTLQLFGSKITPVDKDLIPTGEIVEVKGTPYDFLWPQQIGSRINEVPGGYVVNYAVDRRGSKPLSKVAVVHDNKSGRTMEMWSNQPGVQLYTSNYLGSVEGKGGYNYSNHAAFCLETQGFPDAVNHPNFPSIIVNTGQTYRHVMLHRFTAKK